MAVFKWLDDRTGVPSALRHFLDEDIPASAGWHQVFGSVALFAFLVQLLTGLLLALNYSPTPGEAHASIRYIMNQVSSGPVIRGLHHWGASAMIVVVALHLIQVFIWGAYKRPREATWVLGCLLLMLTMAFGLSGYLLPWDNRAYWGTIVTTQIVALTPGLGSYLQTLLGAEGGRIGVVTFGRFYTAHVVLLPLITGLLIALHVYLVRRHGVAPQPADEERPSKKFYPEQVFKDTVAVFLYVVIIALMANFAKVGLGSVADPTDTSYTPRPEWYFLFLFQLLKVFQGPLEVLGAVILPNVAILVLILVPFLDRGRTVRFLQRKVAIIVVVLAIVGWAGLTQQAVATTPPSQEDPEAGLKPPTAWNRIPASQLAGIGYFRQENCQRCHVLEHAGSGPDLAKQPSTKSPEWLAQHFRQPDPNGAPAALKDQQVNSLISLVTKRDEQGLDAWESAPPEAAAGAMIFAANDCASCHAINGSGGNEGPPLNGVSRRHTRDWIEQHFSDPPKFSPGSEMPDYHFNKQDMDLLVNYLLAIPN